MRHWSGEPEASLAGVRTSLPFSRALAEWQHAHQGAGVLGIGDVCEIVLIG